MTNKLALLAAALLCACSGSDKSDTPNFPNPGEPNESIGTATAITPGTPVAATISSGADYDFYGFTVPVDGATVRVRTFDQSGTSCGNFAHPSVDTIVDVYDTAWNHVGQFDDSLTNFCEDFTTPLPGGTNFVAVSGNPDFPFVYTLEVTIL